MKKFLNKRLADYTIKDALIIVGVSILATPVIWAATILPFTITDKVDEHLKQKRYRKNLDEDENWFEETEKEP